MIIVEGPDGCGKSTLIKQLLHRIPKLEFGEHSPGPPKSAEEYLARAAKWLIKPQEKTRNIILDRFLFSEQVYGPVLRGKLIITQKEMDILEAKLLEHDPLIIYCRRPPHKLHLNDKDHISGVSEKISQLVRQYDKIFSTWTIPKRLVVYDYEQVGLLSDVILEVMNYLEEV